MNVGERMGLMSLLPSVHPIDSNSGAVAGTYISLKAHQRVTVVVSLGVMAAGTVTIQLLQAVNVAAGGAKALNFTHVWRIGGKVLHGATTGAFQVGEIVTGVGSGATGLIHKIDNGAMVIYEIAGTFAIADVLTGTTSAATATAITAMTEYGLNCRVAMAAAANTIALTIAGETYEIEIEGSDLDINNGFDCMVAGVSAAGGANLVAINYLLSKLRYKQEPQRSAYQD